MTFIYLGESSQARIAGHLRKVVWHTLGTLGPE